MICQNCGAEAPDGVVFCMKCGTKLAAPQAAPTQVQPEPQPIIQPVQQAPIQPQQTAQPTPAPISIPKKRFIPAPIIAGVVALAILIAGVVICIKTSFFAVARSNEQYKKGERMYAAEFYDKAAERYQNAYTINVENAAAYLGHAKALVAMDKYEEAIKVLTLGKSATKDKEIKEYLEEIEEIWDKMTHGIHADVDIIYSSLDDCNYFLYNGEVIATIDARSVGILTQSFDHATGILYDYGTYDTYYYNSKGITLIENAVTAKISSDGSTIAYLTEDEDLYFYDAAKEKSKFIDDDVNSFVLSPSGSSVAYSQGSRGELYVNDTEKSTHLKDFSVPLAVSDDGKTVYYINEDDAEFCVIKNKKEAYLCDSDYVSELFFNADLSQVLYIDDDDEIVYLYENGDKTRIYSDADYIYDIKLATGNRSYQYNDYNSNNDYSYSYINYYVTDIDSFINENLYVSYYDYGYEHSIITINSKKEATCLARNIDYYLDLDFTTKNIAYIDEYNELYFLHIGDDPIHVDEDVSSIFVTEDGTGLYYITQYSELYYYSVKSKNSTFLADDVRNGTCFGDNAFYFYDEDNTLYTTTDGKKVKELFDDTNRIYTGISTLYVVLNNDDGGCTLYTAGLDQDLKEVLRY